MKGSSPTILNWIFVLLAGGSILLFTFKALAIQAEITTIEVQADLTDSMQSLVISREVGAKADVDRQIPEVPFVFTCNEPCSPSLGCDSSIQILGSASFLETTTEPIFSPALVQSPRLLAFTLPYDVPFRGANMVLLTTPQNHYQFPNQTTCTLDATCSQVYSLIPSRLKAQLIVTRGASPSPMARNVTFQATNLTCANSRDELCIVPSENKLYFANESGITGEQTGYEWAFPEDIVAAVFADNPEAYECGMKKVYYKVKSTAQILEQKRSILQQQFAGNCRYGYNKSKEPLENLTKWYDERDAQQMITSSRQLEVQNAYLQRNTCTQIY